MSAAILLRDDCDGSALRLLAWQSRDPDPTRVFWRLRRSTDGVPRSEATRAGGAGVQIVRDWCSASTPRALILSAEDDADEFANATSRRTRIISVEPPLPPGYLIEEP